MFINKFMWEQFGLSIGSRICLEVFEVFGKRLRKKEREGAVGWRVSLKIIQLLITDFRLSLIKTLIPQLNGSYWGSSSRQVFFKYYVNKM